jgi:FPC/CPF motif-containing protein YcgG
VSAGNPFPAAKVVRSDRAPSLAEARKAFRDFVMRQEFPCVGARAAFNAGAYVLGVYGELAAEDSTAALSHDLYDFTRSELRRANEFATLVAIFRASDWSGEEEFERRLWQQLTALNRADAAHFDWDPGVRSDPSDPQFSFSFAGQAVYVIGMHPESSRIARKFRWPTLVFNPHEQFEQLRAEGKWQRLQHTIRERDRQLQGSINPMLSDFGEATEARQYSGRAVPANWRAPFRAIRRMAAGKCPFAH